MCGRYDLSDITKLKERFELEGEVEAVKPNANLKPGQQAPIILRNQQTNKNELRLMRWGLVPTWAKDEHGGYKTINARAETLAEKPTYKRPLVSQRCIVPVNGFYEWKGEGRARRPYRFYTPASPLFGLAGLYDHWQRPDGSKLETYTIITKTPTEFMKEWHDRMPVTLAPDEEELWLAPETRDVQSLTMLLEASQGYELKVAVVEEPL